MELQPIFVRTGNTNKSPLEVWKLEPYPKVTILLFYHFSIENNNVIVKCNTQCGQVSMTIIINTNLLGLLVGLFILYHEIKLVE